MAAKRSLTRRQVLILALLLSAALYLAGLFSGLAASSVVREQSREEFGFLVGYVETLEEELRSLQIQEAFVDSLGEERRCELAESYFAQVAEQLNYYWSVFPTRLEAFERERELSPEYLRLKEEYTRLSLRAWIVARENAERCGSETVPVLYFYSRDCAGCVAQGEVLDGVKEALDERNITLVAFTLDLEQEEPSMALIRRHYNITEVPALLIAERTLQGRLFSEAEIAQAVMEGRE